MTAPNTPGQRVANPQAPLAGASDASGSTIRVTHGLAPTAYLSACLAAIDGDRRFCHLRRYHAGSCLPLPVPQPRDEITRENPSSNTRSAST